MVQDYLKAIRKEDIEPIHNIWKGAVEEGLPIIRNDAKQLLEVLLVTVKPKRILEIGTCIGYSAIMMSQYLQEGGTITTIERWEEMAKRAEINIRNTGKEDVIELLRGDAQEVLPTLEGTYDFIFMDAAKAQYIAFLPHCLRLLRVGGLLVSDNVLQDGCIAKSKWSIPRRQRTIHSRMREYLYEISHHECLQTAILPLADGVTISCKIKEV